MSILILSRNVVKVSRCLVMKVGVEQMVSKRDKDASIVESFVLFDIHLKAVTFRTSLQQAVNPLTSLHGFGSAFVLVSLFIGVCWNLPRMVFFFRQQRQTSLTLSPFLVLALVGWRRQFESPSTKHPPSLQ